MTRSDDLASVLAAAPPGAVRFGQGTILTWNPSTFENTVRWRDKELTNVPIQAGTDALAFQVGDTVGLLGWDASGKNGVSQYWITGRIIVPGAGAAEEAIAWMTTTLARSISAAVLASRIHSDFVLPQGTTSTVDDWVDITFAGNPSPGPAVTAEISESGRAIVLLNGQIASDEGRLVHMGFEVSGATSLTPDQTFGQAFNRSPFTAGESTSVGTTGLALMEDLNPGDNTFIAKYRQGTGTGADGAWSRRVMVVFAF